MERELIQRRKLYEEVAARLEAQIHAGHFAEGEQLPSERELMELYGVGRPAVREALLSLQTMGLITIRSGERARVTVPSPTFLFGQLSGAARRLLATPEGVRYFQEARLLFETAIARFAAERAGEARLAALEAALEANEAALPDRTEFERTDVAFHYELATIPENPIFTALHQAMVEWLTEQRSTSLHVAGADRWAFECHRRIFEAVRDRDPDRAEHEMRRHLEGVAKRYWEAVGNDGRLRHSG